MQHRRHHGQLRLKSLHELQGVNVVLTTYHTVLAEWRSDDSQESSVLFSVRWNRIILDEGANSRPQSCAVASDHLNCLANLIQNTKARRTKAVCALRARARWAVTGTPIQNRLSDFASLLQFIRVYPYDDQRYFDSDIANLWKSGEEVKAVERLQQLSRYVLLRRPKDTIDLPPRQDLLCPVELTREERTRYEELRKRTIKTLDDALNSRSGSYKAGSYMNALQQIESLRLFCDLGLNFRAHHKQSKVDDPDVTADNWPLRAQTAFRTQREMYPIICLQCDSVLELTESLLESEDPQLAYFSSCMRFTCANCTWKLKSQNCLLRCGHQSSCPAALVSLSTAALEEVTGPQDFQVEYASDHMSSKVHTLINDIRSRPSDEKW
jgi:hypothetical protein